MKPLKEPRSYDEQIARLTEEHGLIIENPEAAREILSRVNYYRLSAYGIGLKQRENPERFVEGITLKHLYRLYCFDSKLRSIIIPAIESIEIEFRTKLAYHLAMTYGAEGYQEKSNFIVKTDSSGNDIYDVTVKQKLANEIKKQKNLPCVKHHNEVYGGHFPIWVAVELFSFGMLSSLYSVLKDEDKKAVAKEYNTDPKHLKSWVLALQELRNYCAHYNRIYNMPFKQTASLYKEYKKYEGNRLFSVLLVIKRITHNNESWRNLLAALSALLEEYTEANLIFMEFPTKWYDILSK